MATSRVDGVRRRKDAASSTRVVAREVRLPPQRLLLPVPYTQYSLTKHPLQLEGRREHTVILLDRLLELLHAYFSVAVDVNLLQ